MGADLSQGGPSKLCHHTPTTPSQCELGGQWGHLKSGGVAPLACTRQSRNCNLVNSNRNSCDNLLLTTYVSENRKRYFFAKSVEPDHMIVYSLIGLQDSQSHACKLLIAGSMFLQKQYCYCTRVNGLHASPSLISTNKRCADFTLQTLVYNPFINILNRIQVRHCVRASFDEGTRLDAVNRLIYGI